MCGFLWLCNRLSQNLVLWSDLLISNLSWLFITLMTLDKLSSDNSWAKLGSPLPKIFMWLQSDKVLAGLVSQSERWDSWGPASGLVPRGLFASLCSLSAFLLSTPLSALHPSSASQPCGTQFLGYLWPSVSIMMCLLRLSPKCVWKSSSVLLDAMQEFPPFFFF